MLPATIIHVAIAQIEPGQTEHLATLIGLGIVTGLVALQTAPFSYFVVNGWQACEENQNCSETETTTS